MGQIKLVPPGPYEMPPLDDVNISPTVSGLLLEIKLTTDGDKPKAVKISADLSVELAEKMLGQLQAALVSARARRSI
jgi:hypothetical protein